MVEPVATTPWCRYACAGIERAPTTGRDHLQAVLCLKSASTDSAVAKRLRRMWGWHDVHVKPAHDLGVLIEYCQKEGDFMEFGKVPKQGRRSDLESIRSAIRDGATDLELADNHFGSWVRYRRAFSDYRALISSDQPRGDPKLHVFWGDSGTGKSTRAFTEFQGAYMLNRPNCGTVWWDGYTGQSVVVIDEFYGWIPYSELLRVCDKWPHRVRTTLGYVPFVATTIVFTSNRPWTSWYPRRFADDGCAALARRLSQFGTIIHFQKLPGLTSSPTEIVQEVDLPGV
jgi:hypothetical protein